MRKWILEITKNSERSILMDKSCASNENPGQIYSSWIIWSHDNKSRNTHDEISSLPNQEQQLWKTAMDKESQSMKVMYGFWNFYLTLEKVYRVNGYSNWKGMVNVGHT